MIRERLFFNLRELERPIADAPLPVVFNALEPTRF